MSTELLTLLLSALLCLLLPLIYSVLYARQAGLKTLSGNREQIPEPEGAAGRGIRAHRNLLENLLPYAIVILIADSTGISNSYTVASAWIFLGARAVHAVTYLAGITLIRSLAYNLGLLATLVIAAQIVMYH